MRFSAFVAVSILQWATSTIAQQVENLLDTTTTDDPDLSNSLADLPVTNRGDSEKSSGSSDYLLAKANDHSSPLLDSTDSGDPTDSIGSFDVTSTGANEPQHLSNPMLLADDEVPPISLNVPPCSFGNPIVPGNIPGEGGPPWKLMDPTQPSKASKQLYCCIRNFLSCVKYFTPDGVDLDNPNRDTRCDSNTNWMCCIGIKDDEIDSKKVDGEGMGCVKPLFRTQSETNDILRALRNAGGAGGGVQWELPTWMKGIRIPGGAY